MRNNANSGRFCEVSLGEMAVSRGEALDGLATGEVFPPVLAVRSQRECFFRSVSKDGRVRTRPAVGPRRQTGVNNPAAAELIGL